MKSVLLVALLVAVPASIYSADVKPLLRQLIETSETLDGIPFGEVVAGNTGKKLIPIKRSGSKDRALVSKIESALDHVLKRLSARNHKAHKQRRINEVSRFFEDAILEELNKVSGFRCEYPKTASGRTQRSGYPDLRLVDETSGRVVYLDPKLFQSKSRNSSLRTFYFTPKLETNKILDDAHHLLIGISHEGKQDGAWKFSGWELVDLSGFKVRLKAEFQGSNRDIYREENIVGRSKER